MHISLVKAIEDCGFNPILQGHVDSAVRHHHHQTRQHHAFGTIHNSQQRSSTVDHPQIQGPDRQTSTSFP